MIREQALKIVLVVVGILFLAAIYPLVGMHLPEDLQMMLGIYVTLGFFLLLASRNPSANRSLIAFAAWSSIVHAAVMTAQALHDAGERLHFLSGSSVFAIVGVALIALTPRVRTAV